MAESIKTEQDTLESQEVNKEELALAADVMLAMVKTSKGFKMYLPNNPLLVKFVDELKEKIGRHLSLYSEYKLEIDQFELRYKGKTVYENDDPKESMAFKMYSDGIRYVILTEGLEEYELCGFLEIIGKDRPGDVDDDIVTLLWEKNFPHLTYILDEDFLEFDFAGGGSVATESQQGRISGIYKALSSEAPPSPLVLIPQKVLTLTEEEIESLKRAREEEEKRRPLEEVVQIISSILVGEKDLRMFGEFLEIMAKLIEGLANAGDIRLTLSLVRFLGNLAQNENTPVPKRELIARAMPAIFSERNVPVLARSVDKTDAVAPKEMVELLRYFGHPMIGRMCELLGIVESMKMRKAIIQVLIELGPATPEAFVPFLSDRRWYLVRNIVFILTRIGTPVAVDQVVALIAHREPRVRREVLGYLESIDDPKAKTYMMRFLRDSSSAIRIRALKVLAGSRSVVALKPILAIAASEQFAEKEMAEKKAVYEAIGELGGKEALPMFRDMLMKKYWFNKAKEKESVACAVAGLSRMRGDAVVKLLEEAKVGRSEELREIITQAIQTMAGEGAKSAAGP